MPPYATRRLLRCFVAGRCGHGARHKRDHMVPRIRNAQQYTNTGPPLPDFSLQNTCKFALLSAAWITMLVMWVVLEK
jgi:hypothetical protein